MKKTINPKIESVISEGPLLYHAAYRCHNVLRLKAGILNEYPDLKEAKKAHYRAELWKTYDELEQRVKEIITEKQGIPLLVFLFREK